MLLVNRPLMTFVLLNIFLFVCPPFASSQIDNISSGRAIRFDGVDDYIDLGNIYDDIALPVTVSAWVYFEPDEVVTQYPIFTSQDNTIIYNGFTLVVSTLPHIGFTVGDGKGGNNPAFRRSRAGYYNEPGKWMHIAAVARTPDDMHTFLNGYDVSREYQGTSTSPMNSYSPGEVAKIGAYYANGLYYWFKGIIDEVRVWNRALTVTEIRDLMCQKLTGKEAGLIGYWNFDETSGNEVKDLSPNGYHGTIKGNPTRVFSGAPLGDESVNLYTTSWSGKTLAKDGLNVSNVSETAFGVHLYSVNQLPSQRDGLPATGLKLPYHGVFLADDSKDNVFDLQINDECATFARTDNSRPLWNRLDNFTGLPMRVELISTLTELANFDIDLGDDITICDNLPLMLRAVDDPQGKSVLWNTGQTTAEITVNTSGTYVAEVTQECGVATDTIHVTFSQVPPPFSLGDDELICTLEPHVLSPNLEQDDAFDFTWHDGSKDKFFLLDDFGTYWLKLETDCGISVDSITIEKKKVTSAMSYNFFSPNHTDTLNQYFMVDEPLVGSHVNVFNRWGKLVFESRNYQNNWDGDDLPAGVYFYTIHGECIEPRKGAVTIMR